MRAEPPGRGVRCNDKKGPQNIDQRPDTAEKASGVPDPSIGKPIELEGDSLQEK